MTCKFEKEKGCPCEEVVHSYNSMLRPLEYKSEVPDTASKAAKKMGQVYNQLKEAARAGKWANITSEDIALKYYPFTADVEVKGAFVDANNHKHYFCLLYNNSNNPPIDFDDFGNEVRCNLTCSYFFAGQFDDDRAGVVMSFVDYISTCLPKQVEVVEKYNYSREGFYIPVSFDTAFDMFCILMDIVISNIKPIEWFYEKRKLGKVRYAYYKIYKDCDDFMKVFEMTDNKPFEMIEEIKDCPF